MQATYKNAAVLPYNTYHNSTTGKTTRTYYFGLEKSNKLSTFGGRKERADNNHPSVTAAREFKEEAHVWNGHNVKRHVRNGDVVKTKGAVTFVAQMPNVGNPSNRFAELKKSKKFKHLPAHQKEVKAIVNVSRRELIRAVDNYILNHKTMFIQGHAVRGCVARTLAKARSEGKL